MTADAATLADLGVMGLVVATTVAAATSQGRWRAWPCALALPALLLRTGASFGLVAGFAVVAAAVAVGTWSAWDGVLPGPRATVVVTAVVTGLTTSATVLVALLGMGADPLLGLGVLAGVTTAMEALAARGSPYGEWGALAHGVARRRWALWLAARGPWAVTLGICLASGGVGVWWVTGASAPLAVAVLVVAGTLVGSRLAGPGGGGLDGVRVVGLVAHDPASSDGVQPSAPLPAFLAAHPVDDDAWDALVSAGARGLADLLARTEQAVADGADLVVWSEGAAVVADSDVDTALTALAATARRAGGTVVAGLFVVHRASGTSRPSRVACLSFTSRSFR